MSSKQTTKPKKRRKKKAVKPTEAATAIEDTPIGNSSLLKESKPLEDLDDIDKALKELNSK